jgi:hypothetical protein
MLRSYPRPITVVDNPRANLAVSRNLGIRAASGDVVAFIDDDAIPEPGWLEQAMPHFDDPEVAGVGGVVLDHLGMALQYRYSAATRFGETMTSNVVAYDVCCAPGAAIFPYLQGTNALFRRDLLGKIGLFDETFDFYLDETDVCCRLVDAGYLLRQVPDAAVHHKVLPSARRNSSRAVTRWFSIMRNHVYFSYRHALLAASTSDIEARTQQFLSSVLGDARYHEDRNDVEPGHVERARAECEAAIAEGTRLGLERAFVRDSSVELGHGAFTRFLGAEPSGGLRVVFATSADDPQCTDEVQDFIRRVAPELARAGHEVRHFVGADSDARVELNDGVWTHRLLSTAEAESYDGPLRMFASMILDELTRIAEWWRPDVISGSPGVLDALDDIDHSHAVPTLPLRNDPYAMPAHRGPE